MSAPTSAAVESANKDRDRTVSPKWSLFCSILVIYLVVPAVILELEPSGGCSVRY